MKNNKDLSMRLYYAFETMIDYGQVTRQVVSSIHYVDVQKNVITIVTHTPGLIIGKGGANIDTLIYIIETRLNEIYEDLDVFTTRKQATEFLNNARKTIEGWERVTIKIEEYSPFYPHQNPRISIKMKRHSPQNNYFMASLKTSKKSINGYIVGTSKPTNATVIIPNNDTAIRVHKIDANYSTFKTFEDALRHKQTTQR